MASKQARGDLLYLILGTSLFVVGLGFWIGGMAENSVALTYAARGEPHGGGDGFLGLGTALLVLGSVVATIFLVRRG